MSDPRFYKALLIPINKRREIFIQDRRGFKFPDWGFFGGGIEADENPAAAVIREANEELTITIHTSEILYMGQFDLRYKDQIYHRHVFLYPTNQVEFIVREGRGGIWVTPPEAAKLIHETENFNDLWNAIEQTLDSMNTIMR